MAPYWRLWRPKANSYAGLGAMPFLGIDRWFLSSTDGSLALVDDFCHLPMAARHRLMIFAIGRWHLSIGRWFFAMGWWQLGIGHRILALANATLASVDDFCHRPRAPRHRAMIFAISQWLHGIGHQIFALFDFLFQFKHRLMNHWYSRLNWLPTLLLWCHVLQ